MLYMTLYMHIHNVILLIYYAIDIVSIPALNESCAHDTAARRSMHSTGPAGGGYVRSRLQACRDLEIWHMHTHVVPHMDR